MSQHLVFVSVTTLALALASTTQAASVRMFLSETGTDNGRIDGGAGTPRQVGDPDVAVGTARFWVWVELIGDATVNGLHFDLRARHANINGYHFWNHSLLVSDRWEVGGYPGQASDQDTLAEDLIFVAVTTPGVTNGPLVIFDAQHDLNTNSTVIGYVDMRMDGGATLDIVFREGSIAAPNTWDRTYLGLDDTVGNPGSGFYDNRSSEAFQTPEPTCLVLFALAGLALRRR